MGDEFKAYKPYEARLIQLLAQRFEKSALRVSDHLKVGDLPLEIDLVAVSPQPEWSPDFTVFPRLFEYFRRYNILEIKTEHDRLESEDLPKLIAYAWLYMSKQSLITVSEVTATALVHHLPAKIREALPQMGFVLQSKDVYRGELGVTAYVICYADLPEQLVPEELQAFTSSARREKVFLSALGRREKNPLVETIVDLYESEVKKIMLNIREESLKNILEAVGLPKIVSVLGAERVISLLGEDRFISALGEEKVISALGEEKVISALGEEKVISALGEDRIISNLSRQKLQAALSKEEMIAALGGRENLLQMLLAMPPTEQPTTH